MTQEPQTIPVLLRVDFAHTKLPYEETIRVVEGTTPKKAVAKVFPIESGKVCCESEEVVAIDGIAVKPDENLWWYCSVNGEGKTVSPHRTLLKENDFLEWKYSHVIASDAKQSPGSG
jgi:hypothetical protein